jgi:hypothetical protein
VKKLESEPVTLGSLDDIMLPTAIIWYNKCNVSLISMISWLYRQISKLFVLLQSQKKRDSMTCSVRITRHIATRT